MVRAEPYLVMDAKKRLRSVADQLWFEKNLKENCEVCSSPVYLQVHHFYYKSSYGHLRYDNNNAVTLCRKCHFVLHHQDPKKVEEKIIDARGKVWHRRIQKESRKTLANYQNMAYYKNAIKKLNE